MEQKNTSDYVKTNSLRCNNDVGYLTNRIQESQIPPECLVCNKLLECIQKT
jgi:hypothetical protein